MVIKKWTVVILEHTNEIFMSKHLFYSKTFSSFVVTITQFYPKYPTFDFFTFKSGCIRSAKQIL